MFNILIYPRILRCSALFMVVPCVAVLCGAFCKAQAGNALDEDGSALDKAIQQQEENSKQIEQNLNDSLNVYSRPEGKSGDITPRIYVHFRSPQQPSDQVYLRGKLESIWIDGRNIVVPKMIVVNSGPTVNQLRFFHKSEAAEAQFIAKQLSELIVDLEVSDQSQRYENSPAIRPRHYELWLEPDFKPK